MLKYIFAVLVLWTVAAVYAPEAQASRGDGSGCSGATAGCAGASDSGAGCAGLRGAGPVRRVLFSRGPIRRLLFGRR